MISLSSSKHLQYMIFFVDHIGHLVASVLIQHFWGWEESDYGNLQMVRGVFDSGFCSYDMNHMPVIMQWLRCSYLCFLILFGLYRSNTFWLGVWHL